MYDCECKNIIKIVYVINVHSEDTSHCEIIVKQGALPI